jgi:hypothetical protein
MKYLLNSLLMASLASPLCISDTFSQFNIHKKPKTNSFTFGDKLANPLKDGSLVEARVSQPALIAFKNSFQNVTSTKWYRVQRNYLVYFKKNENVSKAIYDARGNLVSSAFYGSEKDLPIDVKSLVKRDYPDYDILLTIEVYDGDRTVWVINLGNHKSLVSVSVENGFINKIGRHKKSK